MSGLDEAARHRAEEIALSLWQGDLLATPVAVTLEAPDSSEHESAHELDTVDDAGVWAPAPVVIPSGWSAIVTQTCDAVRAIDDVRYLQLMPLVDLPESEWNDALYGRRGTQFALPAPDGLGLAFPAIDTAISFPVAKAALAHPDVRTLSTPLDGASRILLSAWLMRRVGRYPFPDELEHHVLRPLRQKIARSLGKTSQGGLLADTMIGLWCSTEWTAGVSLIFIVDQNRLRSRGVNIDLNRATDELLAPAHKALGAAGHSTQLTATVRTFDDVSAYDLMIRHRQVDLDDFPTGGFAAKDTVDALAAASRAAPE